MDQNEAPILITNKSAHAKMKELPHRIDEVSEIIRCFTFSVMAVHTD